MSIKFQGEKGAHISFCGNYRYSLWRKWDEDKKSLMFICLNPSIADAQIDDRTLRRCINFAKTWGFGSIFLGNLFAYRATRVSDMLRVPFPVGELNDLHIMAMLNLSNQVICAWGNHGAHKGRYKEVLSYIKNPCCLKLNKTGQPAHPLYIDSNTSPVRFIKSSNE